MSNIVSMVTMKKRQKVIYCSITWDATAMFGMADCTTENWACISINSVSNVYDNIFNALFEFNRTILYNSIHSNLWSSEGFS